MTVVEGPRSKGLVARAQNILLRPKAEWQVIAAEPATTQSLFTGYAMILAAIPALARLVWGFMPHCTILGCITFSPIAAVVSAVVYYIVALVGVFVIGLIIDALAPSFDGEKNQVQAMKVAVYSYTAAWLAGVFIVVPFVGGLLTLLGLYSLYLLYAGLPQLMKSPEAKSLGYTVVVVVLAIVVSVLVAVVAGGVAAMGSLGGGMLNPGGAKLSGVVHYGSSTVDVGKLQAAAQQIEAQAKAAQSGDASGKVTAVDPQKLEGLLPNAVAGAQRTGISSTTAGAAGFAGSNAEATYEKGDARITLTVTDLAAAGGLAALAGAVHVESNHQTPTGYEKVSTVNGRLTTEKYDNQAKSGEYSVMVADRFNVSAQGSGVSIDDLKGAVAAVGPDRLEALARG
jgi:hypothetical protein